MRIALDARALTGQYTGDRTYWRNLIRSLAEIDSVNDYVILSRTPVPESDIPDCPNFHAHTVPARSDRTWTLAALPQALRKFGIELVHVQYTAPPRALCPCPIITTVHDISFKLYPEWFTPKDRLLMNLTVPISMQSARCVITDSVSSRCDIQREYHLPEEKLIAIPLGLSAGFNPAPDITEDTCMAARAVIKERYGIDQPFILALGVLQPRKNLEMLASAYGKLKSEFGVPHKLVLVGKAGWITAREAICAAAEKFGGPGAAQHIVFPGYVPDEELPTWYRACSAFAHPSLYEGFGLPPLEAMACGASVLVSDAPALPEVVGDAAVIVPARDPDAWASELHRVLSDAALATRLAISGLQRAACFSWRATAQKTLAVYTAALRDGPLHIET